jgi:hypothetical protein
MRKPTRTIALAVAITAIAAAPAAARKPHAYTAAITSSPLATANGYPDYHGTGVFAGIGATQPLGSGAIVDHVRMTGRWRADILAFEGRETGFLPGGTYRAIFFGTSTVNADGSQAVEIFGTFTGGTGRYRGATGSFTMHGTVPAGSTLMTGSSKGSITC